MFNFQLIHIHLNAGNYIFSLSSFPMKEDSKDEKILKVASGGLYHVTTIIGFDLGLRIPKQRFSRASIYRFLQTVKFIDFFT